MVSELVDPIAFAQLRQFGRKIDVLEQIENGLGAHLGLEFVAIGFHGIEILLVGHELAALERRHARVQHQIGLEVQNALDIPQRHVQHQADAGRQRLEEPDMGYRAGQVDMAHAFAAHLGQRDLGTALFALHAAVLHALVLAAQALVVLDRPEDRGTEQAFTLGFEGSVVDRFRLFDLAKRPGADHVRLGQTNANSIKISNMMLALVKIQQITHVQILLDQDSSSSILMPSDRISLTNTLKDSGIPATMRWLPSTIALYIWFRPCTSSDLTVSISCSV